MVENYSVKNVDIIPVEIVPSPFRIYYFLIDFDLFLHHILSCSLKLFYGVVNVMLEKEIGADVEFTSNIIRELLPLAAKNDAFT